MKSQFEFMIQDDKNTCDACHDINVQLTRKKERTTDRLSERKVPAFHYYKVYDVPTNPLFITLSTALPSCIFAKACFSALDSLPMRLYSSNHHQVSHHRIVIKYSITYQGTARPPIASAVHSPLHPPPLHPLLSHPRGPGPS